MPVPVVPPSATGWSEDLVRFILGLTPADLPPAPFRLHPWAEVLNSGRYLAWLQRDVVLGLRSPRARYGVLQNDMERLRECVLQYRRSQ